MKTFYLIGSILLTVAILVVSFGNIQANISNFTVFFFSVNANPTIILLGMAALGILTGFLYHAFLSKLFADTDSEEQEF